MVKVNLIKVDTMEQIAEPLNERFGNTTMDDLYNIAKPVQEMLENTIANADLKVKALAFWPSDDALRDIRDGSSIPAAKEMYDYLAKKDLLVESKTNDFFDEYKAGSFDFLKHNHEQLFGGEADSIETKEDWIKRDDLLLQFYSEFGLLRKYHDTQSEEYEDYQGKRRTFTQRMDGQMARWDDYYKALLDLVKLNQTIEEVVSSIGSQEKRDDAIVALKMKLIEDVFDMVEVDAEQLVEQIGNAEEMALSVNQYIKDVRRYRDGQGSKPELFYPIEDMPPVLTLDDFPVELPRQGKPLSLVPNPLSDRLVTSGYKSRESAERKSDDWHLKRKEQFKGDDKKLAQLEHDQSDGKFLRKDLNDIARVTYESPKPQDADRMERMIMRVTQNYTQRLYSHLSDEHEIDVHYWSKDEVLPGGYYNRGMKVVVHVKPEGAKEPTNAIVVEVKLSDPVQQEAKRSTDPLYGIMRDMKSRNVKQHILFSKRELLMEDERIDELRYRIAASMVEVGRKHPVAQLMMNRLPEYEDDPIEFAKGFKAARDEIDKRFDLTTDQGFDAAYKMLKDLHLAVHTSPNVSKTQVLRLLGEEEFEKNYDDYQGEFTEELFDNLSKLSFDDLDEVFSFDEDQKWQVKTILSDAFQEESFYEKQAAMEQLLDADSSAYYTLYIASIGFEELSQKFGGENAKLNASSPEWKKAYNYKIVESEAKQFYSWEKLSEEEQIHKQTPQRFFSDSWRELVMTPEQQVKYVLDAYRALEGGVPSQLVETRQSDLGFGQSKDKDQGLGA